MITVPSLTYVSLTVDPSTSLTLDDKVTILSMFLCILAGALLQLTSDLTISIILVVLSYLFFVVALHHLLKAQRRLDLLLEDISLTKMVSTQYKYEVLMARRKLTLSKCICILCWLFPLFLALGHFRVMDEDTMLMSLWISSAFSKIMFCALCTDAHLELTHPAIYLYELETKSNATRRAFLRYVFHEVRVPLNSISLGIQLLGGNVKNFDEADAETFRFLNEATSLIGETLNDVLVLQKIEEGALALVLKPFVLRDLLISCISPDSDMYDAARSKNVKLRHKVASNIPEVVKGDKYRLRHDRDFELM